MKVSRQKSAENRERILDAASRLFRERGLAGVGVDALSEAAGLSHGGLYSQFGSKEALVAEALRHAFAGSASRYEGVEDIAHYAARYLSTAHRDNPGGGCAVAALASDIPHQGDGLRTEFTDGLRGMIARVERLLPEGEDPLSVVATLVGAMALARAVDDPELSESLLAAGRRRVAG